MVEISDVVKYTVVSNGGASACTPQRSAVHPLLYKQHPTSSSYNFPCLVIFI